MDPKTKILFLALLVFVTSCDLKKKLGVSFPNASVEFSGIKEAKQTGDGSFMLSWDPVSQTGTAKVNYLIYMQEMDSAPVPFPASSTVELSTRSTVKSTVSDDASPQKKGSLVVTLTNGETSYKLTENLRPQLVYAFQVLSSSNGTVLPNSSVIYASATGANYQGCLTAETKSLTEILITFQFPTDASQTDLYRNGNKIFSTSNPHTTSYTDSGLSPGKSYEYTCKATSAAKDFIGSKIITASTSDPAAPGAFQGCLSGSVLGPSKIKINFEFPSSATKLTIERNGIAVFSTSSQSTTQFTDTGLSEGVTYIYSCVAQIADEELVGSKTLTLRTQSTNAPTFAGISSVTVLSPSSVSIRWGVATGVPATQFQIFGSIGSSVTWTSTPLATADEGVLLTSLGDLGDELTYSFGVRACSVDGICDSNTATITKTMPDGGAPKTPGATAVALQNGLLNITAPWQASFGAVIKRHVYVSTVPVSGGTPTAFTESKVVVVNTNETPPSAITLSNLTEYTVYSIKVIDEDPSGNLTSGSSVVTIATGDTTPPTFTGLSSLTVGSAGQEETTLSVNFNPIARASENAADGAKNYLLYTKVGGGDACTAGTLSQTENAELYPTGAQRTIALAGLAARTTYSVCLKAQDTAGNVSSTTSYLTRSTLDITAPIFDGVQSVVYSPEHSRVEISWNRSPSTDIKEYRLKIWKNIATPLPANITTLWKSDASYPTGMNLLTNDFDYTDNDVLYVLVDACDTAGAIPGGTENCTARATSSAYVYQLPDVHPPAGFAGIKASGALTTPSEGAIGVSWFTPADWTGYRGFRVYSINTNDSPITDSSLAMLKDCPCTGSNCPDHLASCTVTGLDSYRTYYLHVRAYDDSGNVTTYLDPSVSQASKRTTDTHAPSFVSSLSVAYEGGGAVSLSFTPATDNQYSSEPGAAITYQVWRKPTSTFSSATSPYSDGGALLLATLSGTTNYNDSFGLVDNTYYYYAICAVDSSNNRNCDGNIQNVRVPDVTTPSLSSIATNKTATSKSWNLSWTMSDNSGGTLLVTILSHVSASSSPPAAESDYENTITNEYDITSYSPLSGPLNVGRYIHYLVKVTDPDHNSTTKKLTVYSNNEIAVSSVSRAVGTTAGGKYIVITGTGFAPGFSATLSGRTCTETAFIDSTRVFCKTPAGAAAVSVAVTVINPEGSYATLNDGYTYCDPASCSSICDKDPGTWGNFAGGTGAAATPYLVCTGAHLSYVRNIATGKYYEIRDNLSLASYTANSFVPIINSGSTAFDGFFEGNSYYIGNYAYSAPASDGVGLFGVVSSGIGVGYIRNIKVFNFTITGHNGVGALEGGVDSCPGGITTQSIEGINLTITGNDSVGGIIGRHYDPWHNTGNPVSNLAVENGAITGHSAVGGLIGATSGPLTTGSFQGTIAATGTTVGGLVGGGMVGPYTGSFSATATISGSGTVGGLFGSISSGSGTSLSNSTANVAITVPSGDIVGGLVGIESSNTNFTINGAVVTGSISAPASNLIGGILGTSMSVGVGDTISNSTANMTIQGNSYVGGIFGIIHWSYNSGRVHYITDSSWTGSITGTSYLGGIVGSSDNSSLTRVKATGNVTGTGSFMGGIAGSLTGGSTVIQNSSSSGTVIATATSDYLGGLLGNASPGVTITDSYATGEVKGHSCIAGLVGNTNASSLPNITIRRDYSSGKVSSFASSGVTVGGLLACITGANTDIAADFWDTQTSTQSSSAGGAGVVGKITSDMRLSGTFTGAGWDFTPTTGVWKMPAAGGYPILMWQTE